MYRLRCLSGTLISALIGLISAQIFVPGMATAATAANLYSTEVPIQGQNDQAFQTAAAAALEQVIIKVTGQMAALASPQVQQAMKKPAPYIQRFSYRTEQDKRQWLQVTFVELAIKQLLQQAGLAIWGASRPTTLAWLAVVDEQHHRQRRVLTAITDDLLALALKQHFHHRGLPLIFPLMDIADDRMISSAEVWGLFSDKLVAASSRYGAEAILAGRLSVDNAVYNGRLTLLFRGQRHDRPVSQLNHEQLVHAAADLIGSTLSRHYGVVPVASKQQSLLTVSNVKTTADYAALLHYLDGLTAVSHVDVRKVAGTTVELALTIDGRSNQLIDAIALGRRLRPVAGSTPSNATTATHAIIPYRWIGR